MRIVEVLIRELGGWGTAGMGLTVLAEWWLRADIYSLTPLSLSLSLSLEDSLLLSRSILEPERDPEPDPDFRVR